MALIDLKTNLAQKIGGTNTTETGDFLAKQGDNTERKTNFSDESVQQQYSKLSPSDDQLIRKDVGERYRGTKLDGGFMRGGAALQVERAAEDTKRIGKFLFSPKGALFTVKQSVLQNQNKQRNANIYDPSSVLKNIPTMPHFQRHINESLFSEGLSLSGVVNQLIGGEADNQYVKFVENENFGDNSTRKNYGEVKEAVNYLDIKNKGKKSLQVDYGESFLENGSNLPKDFIKFRIRDMVQGKWIVFPVILTSDIADNSTAQYEEINYVGRPDAVHIYKNMKRSFSIGFKVVATNKDEIPIIWRKIDRLKGLTQPAFKPFLNSSNVVTKETTTDLFTRPTAPIVHLTLGDIFKNTVGYFESVNITIPNSSTWELEDGLQFPHICDVSLNFTHIGNVTPTNESPNYGSQNPNDDLDIFIPPKKEATATSNEVEPTSPEKSKRDERRERRQKRRQDRRNRRAERRAARRA